MTTDNDYAKIITHDTFIISAATTAALRLFGCESLVGRELFDLLASDEFKGLARLRMKLLRERGAILPVRYPFRRFDRNSVFWADVNTVKIDDQTYESTITNIREDQRSRGSVE